LGTASIATTLVAGFSFGFYLALSAAIPTCALAGVFGLQWEWKPRKGELRISSCGRARWTRSRTVQRGWGACIAALGCLIGGALFPVGLG